MKRAIIVAGVLALAAGSATADWGDNFDLYATGSLLDGQGGWHGWDGNPDPAIATDAQARSAPNSALIAGESDLVHEYEGYTSGHWRYTAWQYIPLNHVGSVFFIMLNTYDDGGPYNWSVQMEFISESGLLNADCGSSDEVVMPYVYDEWVEINVDIYLDQDWTQVYYDGTLLDDPGLPDHPDLGGGYSWTGGVFGQGGGALDIAAVDLFAGAPTFSSDAYFDDMSLVPEPASCLLLLAVLGLCRRR